MPQYSDINTVFAYFENHFPKGHIDNLRTVWNLIKKEYGESFPMPWVFPTIDGALQLGWTINQQCFSIDMYRDGYWDWFYRNRTTDETKFGETMLLEFPTDDFFRAMKLLQTPIL